MISKKGILLVFFSFIIVFLAAGCGYKGPPLPPIIDTNKISAPFDLRYSLKEDIVSLSWKHETKSGSGEIKPESFRIFMARKTFDQCEGCPFKFNQIGEVYIPEMEYLIKLEKGFKYYFRVLAAGQEKRVSKYSQSVQIDYK